MQIVCCASRIIVGRSRLEGEGREAINVMRSARTIAKEGEEERLVLVSIS